MKTVFIYPANNNENQYVNVQESAIKQSGSNVTYTLKDFLKTDYFLLNWFETLSGNKKLDYVKKCFKLLIIKLFNKRILWVLHNKKPHTKDSKDKSTKLSIKLMKKLLKQSYKIIILCDDSKSVLRTLCRFPKLYENKIYKIPHPNYIGVYPEPYVKITKTSDDILNILYVGQVTKYKNIDLLINAVNSLNNNRIHLHIAGNCKDKVYKDYLTNISENKNISFDFRFIPDNELAQIISKNDIVALPYSLESSLNSGTIFLAFSYKKTVIAPMIGTLKEFSDRSFFYSYDYSTEDEHKENLKASIKQVYADFEKNRNVLSEKGQSAYNIVKTENSLTKISSLYKELLKF